MLTENASERYPVRPLSRRVATRLGLLVFGACFLGYLVVSDHGYPPALGVAIAAAGVAMALGFGWFFAKGGGPDAVTALVLGPEALVVETRGGRTDAVPYASLAGLVEVVAYRNRLWRLERRTGEPLRLFGEIERAGDFQRELAARTGLSWSLASR